MPTQAFVNSIGLVVLAATLTFLATMFWQRRGRIDREVERKAEKLAAENNKLTERVLDMEKQLGMLNQAVLPISTAFQAILIKELTHYHTPEMDALMVKIGPPNILTDDEMARLVIMLEERTRDMGSEISDSERDAATMLPLVMKRAKFDLDNEKKLQLVSVPPLMAEQLAHLTTDSDALGAIAEKKNDEGNK
jgi:hypothetical protein